MWERCDKDVSKMWASWKLEGAGAGPDKSEAVPHSGNGGCQCGVIIVIYSTWQQRYPLKIRLAFRQGSFNSLKYFPFTLVPCYSLFQPITLFYALRRMNRSEELWAMRENKNPYNAWWREPNYCIVWKKRNYEILCEKKELWRSIPQIRTNSPLLFILLIA